MLCKTRGNAPLNYTCTLLQYCNDDDDDDSLCYKTQPETVSPIWTFPKTLTNNFVNVVRWLSQGLQI